MRKNKIIGNRISESRILLFFSVCFLVCGLLGCGFFSEGEQSTSDPTPTPYPTGITKEAADSLTKEQKWEQTIMRVGDIEVKYGELILFMQSTKEEVQTIYGDDVWDYRLDRDGITYAELLKRELLERFIYVKLVCAQASRLGITLTEDEKMNVAEYTDNYLAGFTPEQLKYYGITEEAVSSIYSDNLIATKIYESLTLNIDTDVSDEEARHIRLWNIYLANFKQSEEGTRIPLTDEESAALKEKAYNLSAEARVTSDFYTLARKNTDRMEEIELVVGRGELPAEIDNAAFNLQAGEASDPIECVDGYYILYLADYMDEVTTDQAKVDIITERQDKVFHENLEQWKKATAIWVDPILWEGIDITGERCE